MDSKMKITKYNQMLILFMICFILFTSASIFALFKMKYGLLSLTIILLLFVAIFFIRYLYLSVICKYVEFQINKNSIDIIIYDKKRNEISIDNIVYSDIFDYKLMRIVGRENRYYFHLKMRNNTKLKLDVLSTKTNKKIIEAELCKIHQSIQNYNTNLSDENKVQLRKSFWIGKNSDLFINIYWGVVAITFIYFIFFAPNKKGLSISVGSIGSIISFMSYRKEFINNYNNLMNHNTF